MGKGGAPLPKGGAQAATAKEGSASKVKAGAAKAKVTSPKVKKAKRNLEPGGEGHSSQGAPTSSVKRPQPAKPAVEPPKRGVISPKKAVSPKKATPPRSEVSPTKRGLEGKRGASASVGAAAAGQEAARQKPVSKGEQRILESRKQVARPVRTSTDFADAAMGKATRATAKRLVADALADVFPDFFGPNAKAPAPQDAAAEQRGPTNVRRSSAASAAITLLHPDQNAGVLQREKTALQEHVAQLEKQLKELQEQTQLPVAPPPKTNSLAHAARLLQVQDKVTKAVVDTSGKFNKAAMMRKSGKAVVAADRLKAGEGGGEGGEGAAAIKGNKQALAAARLMMGGKSETVDPEHGAQLATLALTPSAGDEGVLELDSASLLDPASRGAQLASLAWGALHTSNAADIKAVAFSCAKVGEQQAAIALLKLSLMMSPLQPHQKAQVDHCFSDAVSAGFYPPSLHSLEYARLEVAQLLLSEERWHSEQGVRPWLRTLSSLATLSTGDGSPNPGFFNLLAASLDAERFGEGGRVMVHDFVTGDWHHGVIFAQEKSYFEVFVPTAGAAKRGPKAKKGLAEGDAVDEEDFEDEVELRSYHRTAVLRDSTGYAPGELLLAAAHDGADSVVMMLLELGVSPAEADADANTPLLFAAAHGHTGCCRLLMAAGGDPELNNMHHMSPWDAAVCRRDVVLRRAFRPSDSDIDITTCTMHASFGADAGAVLRASMYGDVEGVKALCSDDSWGGRASHVIAAGVSPLMLAARGGHTKVVWELLRAGARKQQVSAHGCTAFSIASEEGRMDIIELLMRDEARPPEYIGMPSKSGYTPLMRACENGHIDVAEWLLQFPDDLDRVNQSHWTSLMLASYNGWPRVTAALLRAGADAAFHKKTNKYTALCYACYTGHSACVQVLLRAKAGAVAQSGNLALALAIQHEHEECAELLRKASISDKSAWKIIESGQGLYMRVTRDAATALEATEEAMLEAQALRRPGNAATRDFAKRSARGRKGKRSDRGGRKSRQKAIPSARVLPTGSPYLSSY